MSVWAFPSVYPTIIKTMYSVNIRSVSSTKCMDEDLNMVVGCCTAAAHCTPEEAQMQRTNLTVHDVSAPHKRRSV